MPLKNFGHLKSEILKISLLNTKLHDRTQFNCEEASLVEYLQKQAGLDIKKNLAACFVLTQNDQNTVKGYYTLSSESLNRTAIPKSFHKRIPRNYNVPLILLGRLARDISMKGTGAGEYLLIDALLRSYNISKEIGTMAVVADPINKKAIEFYKKYGFILLPDSGKMFLPMKTIAQIF